eukprot:scaffold358_cov207-Alexandrium_tamarense.AAC.28
MACGETSSECSVGAAANLLKDVIYILVRLDEPEEENVFFKSNLQKHGPVQVMMMSGISQANCVKSKTSSPIVHAFVKRTKENTEGLEGELEPDSRQQEFGASREIKDASRKSLTGRSAFNRNKVCNVVDTILSKLVEVHSMHLSGPPQSVASHVSDEYFSLPSMWLSVISRGGAQVEIHKASNQRHLRTKYCSFSDS